MKILICFTFLLALAFRLAADMPPAEIPFRLEEGLLWIEVKAPGTDTPLNFLVDSGAQVSAIHLQTAERLGLKKGRRVSVQGVQHSAAGYWPTRWAGHIGEVRLPSELLALDFARLRAACFRPVDGLLGADFFRAHVVQIDFVAQRIRLLPTSRLTDGTVLALEVRVRGLRVPVRINDNEPQWLRLDTGCASALQWVTSTAKTAQRSTQPAIGLFEMSIAQTEVKVALGPLEFDQVPAGLHRKPIFAGEAGLLGNGLLARFERVTVDASRGQLIFGQIRAAEQPSPPEPTLCRQD